MKNKRIIVAVAGLALLAAGVWAQEGKTVSSGKEVYTKKCASCHGKQGEGVAKMATMLKATIRNWGEVAATADTLAAWKKITTDGKGKMPAFKAKLSAAEMDSVLAYVKSLTKPGKPAKSEGAEGSAKADSAKGAK
ncbi:MAG TPA: cytochrome c [Verrucomicrobiae bacterium]|nr:cytochrome c [Verrucomicrobiae bacterium]